MKCLLLPLFALTLLLGACSSINPASARHPTPPVPVRLANRATIWGEQPSYDEKGQYFVNVIVPKLHVLVPDGTTTLDLLVNRDGTVQKTAVVASCGNRTTDLSVAAMYGKARYSLPLGPDGPATYVVRQTFSFKVVGSTKDSAYGPNDYTSTDYYPTSSPQYSNPGNSNTVNGFVR
jgi:hypothetical protein